MKFLILALIVSSGSAFLAPFNRCSSSALQGHSDLYAIVGHLEGPSIHWGPEGCIRGKDEMEIKGYDSFGQFKAAIEQAGLAKTLQGIGPYTLLAPTDEACAAYQGQLDEDLLKYHIIEGKHATGSFSGDLKTLNGESLTYTRKFRKDFLDDAIIGMIAPPGGTSYPKNIECENGMIHAIDKVLVPGYGGVQ